MELFGVELFVMKRVEMDLFVKIRAGMDLFEMNLFVMKSVGFRL